MTFTVIIPARYASARLPGKPLLDLAGKTMVQHVYERACQSGAQQVVIATDDARIAATAKSFGADVYMTAAHHQSGTERLAETVELLGLQDEAVVVNVQVDEPLIPPEAIQQVAANLTRETQADVATLYEPILTLEELEDPNVVKVVFDLHGYALYFSRAPIAWDREARRHNQKNLSPQAHYYRHIGLYAYRVAALKAYVSWQSSYLEQMEALEQLRFLWHGRRIYLDETCKPVPPGIDTLVDLEYVRKVLHK